MLINEVCKECGLTKKAIEYYETQQLIQPKLLENGYRNFSKQELEELRKIAILRKLGLSVSDIQTVLKGNSKTALYNVLNQKALELEMMKSKQKLAEKLAKSEDWEYTRRQLEILEQKQTISERLLNVFPGYYGKYVSLHFASYLNEAITTKDQQEAFETIISFLDGVDFSVPADLQQYLDEVSVNFDTNFVTGMKRKVETAFSDPEKFILDNQDVLEQYIAFKKSDEYKKSPVYKLQKLFETFNQESGYSEIFIPAMKRLSRSYQNDQVAMEKANEVFLDKYPEVAV